MDNIMTKLKNTIVETLTTDKISPGSKETTVAVSSQSSTIKEEASTESTTKGRIYTGQIYTPSNFINYFPL